MSSLLPLLRRHNHRLQPIREYLETLRLAKKEASAADKEAAKAEKAATQLQVR